MQAVCPGFHPALAMTRRQLLQIGALGVAGLGLPKLLASRAVGSDPGGQGPGFGKAKACILMFMWGGPSQLDTWDLKPDAPSEVRGPFRPIATNVAGIQISEHFPRLSRHADQLAIIRSMTHTDPAHLSSVHHLLTGRLAPKVNSDADPPSRRDWPHVGSMVTRLRPPADNLPGFVTMPWIVSHPAAPGGVAPGQNGGLLGSAFDPFVVAADPRTLRFDVPGLGLPAHLTLDQLSSRQTLLRHVDQQQASLETQGYDRLQARALSMLAAPPVKRAFDLEREPSPVRDLYGRHVHGQCLLLARRLIEAGVTLVSVNWHQDGRNFWDTHGDNFNRLKNDLMPPADRGFAALLEDLTSRGMLDETLLVWVGEFGRAPKINGNGREHWPQCYSAVLAGGGVRGGQVIGKSDRQAAYPLDQPTAPADLTATIYHALGIPADFHFTDREDRPTRLTQGQPVLGLFG